MKNTHSTLAIVGIAFALVSGAFAQQIVYPAKGQSPSKQKSDEAECYTWAVQQTGFDPAKPAAPPPQASGPSGARVRGAAAGATVAPSRTMIEVMRQLLGQSLARRYSAVRSVSKHARRISRPVSSRQRFRKLVAPASKGGATRSSSLRYRTQRFGYCRALRCCLMSLQSRND